MRTENEHRRPSLILSPSLSRTAACVRLSFCFSGEKKKIFTSLAIDYKSDFLGIRLRAAVSALTRNRTTNRNQSKTPYVHAGLSQAHGRDLLYPGQVHAGME